MVPAGSAAWSASAVHGVPGEEVVTALALVGGIVVGVEEIEPQAVSDNPDRLAIPIATCMRFTTSSLFLRSESTQTSPTKDVPNSRDPVTVPETRQNQANRACDPAPDPSFARTS